MGLTRSIGVMTYLILRLLGRFEAETGSREPVDLPGKKAIALLSYLARVPGERHARDKIATLLWGNSDSQHARDSLRQTLARLRRSLAQIDCACVYSHRELLYFDPGILRVDVAEFERLCGEGTPASLGRAASLYRGPFLDGFDLQEEDFEAWLRAERIALHNRARDALDRLLDCHVATNDVERGIRVAEQLLELDPLQEQIHRKLIRLYAATGDRVRALKQYQTCCAVLRSELGLLPDAETEELHDSLRERHTGGQIRPHTAVTVGASATPLLPDRPSIAVLPFVDMSDEPERGYFSDGITADIITELSRHGALFVISHNSSFVYRDETADPRAIGRRLGVAYIVEGSIRRVGDQVRISAQLTECATARHIWAQRFDRELTAIFQIQDEVTREIVSALVGELVGDDGRPTHAGTQSAEAYDFFLRGREQFWTIAKEGIAQAKAMLTRSIELDSGFAPAYALLARTHVQAYANGWHEAVERPLEKAIEFARRAVALDDFHPPAHSAMGSTSLWIRQYDRAIAAYEKALTLDPNSAFDHTALGGVYHYTGRSEEAIDWINRGMRLDPHYHNINLYFLARAHFQLGRYETAIELLKRRLIRKPDSDISRVLLAACHGHLGRVEEAKAEWAQALQVNPEYSLAHRRQVLPYKDPADFEKMVDGLRKAGLLE